MTNVTTLPLFAAVQEVETKDDCWTPSWVFEDMDIRFDLDVAAPPGGVSYIPADRFFTKADDGLAQEWSGRVWMNPPFSAPKLWVGRWLAHGDGVALLPTGNGAWFSDVWKGADGIALLDPYIQFGRLVGGGLPTRVMLFAMGDECVEAIGRVGHVR